MRRKRPVKFLLLSIVSLVSLSLLIYHLPPTYNFSLLNSQLSTLYLFFLLLFLFLFSLITFISKSIKHGILIALFFPIYLLFRINNLTHPFFFLLLFGLFMTLEFLFAANRRKQN